MASQPARERPLRIVIGAVTYPPDMNGAAIFTERLARGLAQRGHDVHVVCLSTTHRASRTVEDGLTLHRLKSLPTFVHPTIRCSPPWRNRTVDRLLAELAPDVVHVQSHFFLTGGLMKHALRRKIALMATNHFMPENMLGYLPIPETMKRLVARVTWKHLVRHYGKAHIVTAPTPRATELLEVNGLPGIARPVSCGMDIQRYRERAEELGGSAQAGFAQDRQARTVLFVGRLDDEKHVDDLIRAMALLNTSAARLEIVGDGSCRQTLEDLAAELGVAERVSFLGFVSEGELLDAYARADLFCMPSIAELQSLATMEAMSAGTAVVLADAMALPHLVESGQNGWLYPPRDIHALARAIDAVISDAATIQRMGAASLRHVAQHDIHTVLGRFEAMYRAAMAGQEPEEGPSVHTGLAS